MAILECKNVNKSYGGAKALEDVSIDVGEKQVLGLIGPNGAGKSTLVDIVSGFTRADSGSVVFNGKDITHMTPNDISNSGLARTFQLCKNFNFMTVWENILVGSKSGVGQEQKKLADKILMEFDFGPLRNQSPAQLAYGEQKMIEIARISMSNPKVAMLDEPSSGVDKKSQDRIISYINTKLRSQAAVLLVEHNMTVVENVCDELVVLDRGKVLCRGTPGEVLHDARVVASYFGK